MLGLPPLPRHASPEAPIVIVITDAAGVIQAVNPAFSRVTGYADYDLAATIERTIAPTRMKRAPTRLPVITA